MERYSKIDAHIHIIPEEIHAANPDAERTQDALSRTLNITAWDAANWMSVRLAEKLGYEFSREYVCYGLE